MAERLGATSCLVGLLLLATSSANAALPDGRALKTRDDVLRKRFTEAIDLYVDGRYAAAEAEFRDIVDSPQLSRRGKQVADFMVGKCLYASRAYGVARNFFAYYINTYPRSPYLAAAYIYTGHALFQLGEMAASVNAYLLALGTGDDKYTTVALANIKPLVEWSLSQSELEILLTSLDEAPEYDWVRLWIADRFMAEGRTRLANDIYHELTSQHPNSETGRIASGRLTGGSGSDQRGKRFVIGVMGPLTGEFEAFGYEMVRGAQLAASRLTPGVTIETFDTQADSARAVALVDSIALRRCDCVIGPLSSDAILGTAPLLDERGIPQILPLARRGGYSGSHSRMFQLSRPPGDQAQELAEYAVQTLHLKELSALVSDTPEGREAANAFAKVVEWEGRTMHPIQYFTPGDTDFGRQLRTLRNRTLPPGLTEEEREDALSYMDGMLVWGDAEDILLIAPQIVFHGFRVYAFGPEGWSDKDGLRRMRTSLDSTIFVSYEWVDESRPAWQAFVQDFEARWAYRPTSLAGRVYDIVNWLGLGVDRKPSSEQIVRTLSGESGYSGATGDWRFDRDGYPAHIPLLHYIDRQIVPVDRN